MYDVVIIGSGAAGLSVALSANKHLNVLVLSADIDNGANSKLAQGGIAATVTTDQASIESHITDTMIAGSNQNNIESVRFLIENSKDAIEFLVDSGVKFDLDNDGNFDMTKEGAHSQFRILHSGDKSGQVIYDGLLAAAQKRGNVTILNEAVVTSCKNTTNDTIVINYNKADCGYSIETNKLVIASGGYGNLFKKTTNSNQINGLNLCIANQLNLDTELLHLMQFHPTGFEDSSGKCHLLTESLRGEGARFYTKENGYFMSDYHKLADIAPRDVTSRAVLDQINKGNQVYLDCSKVAEEYNMETRFSTVTKITKDSGYDISKDMVPITPVAHYSIGGIKVDLHGQTSNPLVYACGEAASTGVHGANRLASNSLLECIVFGREIGNNLESNKQYQVEEKEFETIETKAEEIRTILSKYCNIVRTDEGLKTALKQVNELDGKDKTCDLVLVAKQILEAAIENDSIGCHYKEKSGI